MKKILIAVILLLTVFYSDAQTPPFVQWQRPLGGIASDVANDIQHTADGGYIVACVTASVDGDVTGNHGSYDCWLVKLTAWGSVVWEKCYGGSDIDQVYTVQQTSDGGYIFAGKSRSVDGDVTGNHGDIDLWVVKTDDTGKLQWQRSYGSTNQETALSIQQTTDGGYIAAGWSRGSDGDVTGNHGGEDVWILKLTATGAITWQKNFGGSGDDVATFIQQTSDGGYIVTGNTSSTDGDVIGNHGGIDVWVLKLTSTGSLAWQTCYGGSSDDENGDDIYQGSIQQTADGGYVFAGLTSSTDGDVTGYHGGVFYDYWVVKLTSTGGITWEKCFGGTNDDDGYFVRQTADGGYIVTGATNSTDGDVVGGVHGSYDYWVMKLSSAGSLVWQKTYGGTAEEFGFCVRPTSDSEYVVCGYTKSNDGDVSGNHGDYDAWVVKLAKCNLPNILPISGPATVCPGATIQLSDLTGGGTWSTSNGNATVSTTGVVTGVYGGNVAIFYTQTTACGTGGATYFVNVKPAPVPVITAAGTTLSTTVFSTYQWVKNGTPIAGATNASYNAALTGIYTVIVTGTNGCLGTSAPDTVHGVGVTSINNRNNCSIIPNPTTGSIYVKDAGKVNIRVYNIIGQLMAEARDADHISIDGLPIGMYLVRLFDEQGGLIFQEKVLKK